MTEYILERRLTLPVAPTEAFDFFRDPSNLVPLAPPLLKLRLVAPFPKSIGRGTLVEYRLRLFRFRLRWVVLTTDFDPPRTIGDELVHGPFASWKGRRDFRRVRGGTEVTDTARYGMRFGVFGRMLHAMAVREQLEDIFTYRAARIQAAFGSPVVKPQARKKKSR